MSHTSESYTIFTDGPDRFRGPAHCIDHHNGVNKIGHTDTCCCCNPCLYEISNQLNISQCCKCLPQILCVKFTPDDNQAQCCTTLVSTSLPEHDVTSGNTIYGGGIVGMRWEATLGGASGYECGWTLKLWDNPQGLGDPIVNEQFEIDYVNFSCITVPNLLIQGVTDANNCTGEISFLDYESTKIPFRRPFPDDDYDDALAFFVDYPNSPCYDCTEVCRTLCVYGIREPFGSREAVEFHWGQTWKGPGWEYLPPGGLEGTDDEAIILNLDYDGNCVLEYYRDPQDGDEEPWILPVHGECTCGIVGHGKNTGGRFLYLNCSPCGDLTWICGDCRCACDDICIMGFVNGELYNAQSMQWNGVDRWTSPYVEFDLVLQNNSEGNCVLQTSGLYPPDDEITSNELTCNPFMFAELDGFAGVLSDGNYSWLWAWCSTCGCTPEGCGFSDCNDQCGGPPSSLYIDLWARCDPSLHLPPDDTCPYEEICLVTVQVFYWQRWGALPGPVILDCGYVGHHLIDCYPDEGGRTLLRVEYYHSEVIISSWSEESQTFIEALRVTVGNAATCDPLTGGSEVIVDPDSTQIWCPCSGIVDEYQITIYE